MSSIAFFVLGLALLVVAAELALSLAVKPLALDLTVVSIGPARQSWRQASRSPEPL